MNKPIHHFFTSDHRRLELILAQATVQEDQIDPELYHQFRTGLLKHIKMEEKILFPAAQRANGGIALPLAAKLRLDHGAITSLMVLPPDKTILKVLLHVLNEHDLLEEQPGGMYELCEKLTEAETQNILTQLAQTTEVPVHPFNGADYALKAAKNALARAGYDYDALIQT